MWLVSHCLESSDVTTQTADYAQRQAHAYALKTLTKKLFAACSLSCWQHDISHICCIVSKITTCAVQLILCCIASESKFLKHVALWVALNAFSGRSLETQLCLKLCDCAERGRYCFTCQVDLQNCFASGLEAFV